MLITADWVEGDVFTSDPSPLRKPACKNNGQDCPCRAVHAFEIDRLVANEAMRTSRFRTRIAPPVPRVSAAGAFPAPHSLLPEHSFERRPWHPKNSSESQDGKLAAPRSVVTCVLSKSDDSPGFRD